MLVLTRRIEESVVVGGADRFQHILKVKVLEIRGEKVKLGFEVDPDVPVHRLEVWERISGRGNLTGPTPIAAPVTE
jgi:carbon storage regulator CsrA